MDVSGNMINDLSPLNSLTHLLSLKAEKNNLTTAHLERMPYLQVWVLFSFCHRLSKLHVILNRPNQWFPTTGTCILWGYEIKHQGLQKSFDHKAAFCIFY